MTHFDYLLNAFEQASQADNPAKEGYAEKRRALLAYVRELESYKLDAERYRWVLEHWDTGGPDFGKIMFSSTAETLSADIDTARKGEGE